MPYISYRKPNGRSGRQYKGRWSQRDSPRSSGRPVLRYRQHELGVIETTMVADPNSTGSVASVTPIPQGDDVAFRHGNTVILRRVVVSGSILRAGSGSNTKVRYVLFRDNLGTTTQPVLTDVFKDATQFFSNKVRLGDPQSMARFTILWDWFTILNNSTDRPNTWFHMDKKLNSLCMFTGTASTDEGKGNLYLIQASSEPTNDPAVLGSVQVWFTDT